MKHLEVECAVCTETKNTNEFPASKLTLNCLHPPSACSGCVSASVNVQFETTPSTHISCPECPHYLGMDEIRHYLTEQNFSRYVIL